MLRTPITLVILLATFTAVVADEKQVQVTNIQGGTPPPVQDLRNPADAWKALFTPAPTQPPSPQAAPKAAQDKKDWCGTHKGKTTPTPSASSNRGTSRTKTAARAVPTKSTKASSPGVSPVVVTVSPTFNNSNDPNGRNNSGAALTAATVTRSLPPATTTNVDVSTAPYGWYFLWGLLLLGIGLAALLAHRRGQQPDVLQRARDIAALDDVEEATVMDGYAHVKRVRPVPQGAVPPVDAQFFEHSRPGGTTRWTRYAIPSPALATAGAGGGGGGPLVTVNNNFNGPTPGPTHTNGGGGGNVGDGGKSPGPKKPRGEKKPGGA